MKTKQQIIDDMIAETQTVPGSTIEAAAMSADFLQAPIREIQDAHSLSELRLIFEFRIQDYTDLIRNSYSEKTLTRARKKLFECFERAHQMGVELGADATLPD
jgi:hypothetical protein